jgi:uncharacterized membrane protein
MRCENCGVELVPGSAFCPSCGRPAESSPVAPAIGTPASGRVSAGLEPNVAGFLCYLVGFITGIFFLVADPYKRDHFVRFHAYQAIFLSAAWFAVYFVLTVLLAILPGMLWSVAWFLHSLLGLGFFLLWLLLMYKAYNHQQFRLPVIGDLAARQA